ncbi:MAG: double-strand break repair protein AddB [Alphaproteobacteria bacterium]
MARALYTIPSHLAFLDALADGLINRAGGDVFKLSDSLILLPTRRSCRHLRDAFLKRLKSKSALLPRMQPLGDIDEEEFYFADRDLNTDIPPAIAPLRRQLLLTRLVSARDDAMPLEQAVQLAQALALFLDQVQIENCDLKKLPTLVEKERGNLAEHWQQTVAFLEILTQEWPKILASEKVIDPAHRRNLILKAQADAWRKQPPLYPVIAAGSTGSMPATRELLAVIASMTSGTVILPGLDQTLDEEAWQSVDDIHPQFGMKQLLESMKLERRDVKNWCQDESVSPRSRFLNEAMRPAEVTHEWRHLKTSDIPAISFEGLAKLELDTVQEEAQSIALIMRGVLQTPDKTAALITPDRALAERVSSLLKRWNITANDSAGSPLAHQPIGSFLLDVLNACAPHATPVDYLSLLKHPFAACRLSPAECRAAARDVEKNVWRTDRPEKSPWLDQLKEQLSIITKNWSEPLPFVDRIKAHIAMAEQLATSDNEKGSDRLWVGHAGEEATEWLSELQAAAIGFPVMTGDDYSALFAELLRTKIIRPAYGQHPRLSILGVLEARLLQADCVILGGLNEGSWPPEPPIDPWMSRPMKKQFGLPSPERRIGLAAHDFVQLVHAKDVYLTRSKRAGNAPTVPSRFLLQLDTVLKAIGYSTKEHDVLEDGQPWQAWSRTLDEPQTIKPCAAPEPCPPVASRPSQLRVTDIGTWRRNPYSIYAKYILRLRKLDPLDADPDAADRGNLIHEALDQFITKYPVSLPANALDELLVIGKKVFADMEHHPEVTAIWWPRFERVAAWFVANEAERRSEGIKVLQAEAEGQMTLSGLSLKGRADRIDQTADGLAIIDYKTGGLPSKEDVKSGYEPQLPLLSLIAAEGGFKDVPPSETSELAYWKLHGGRDIADIKPVNLPLPELMEAARAGVKELVEKFSDPTTPYQAVPKPDLQPRYDDYAHLARLAEWGRTEEDQ